MKTNEQGFRESIKALTDAFADSIVDQLKAALRDYVATSGIALSTVSRATNGFRTGPSGGAPMAHGKPEANGKAPKVTAKASKTDSTRATLVACVKKTPGMRSEEMPGVVANGKDVKGAVLKALVGEGYLRCTGRARGTRYFVTKKQFKA